MCVEVTEESEGEEFTGAHFDGVRLRTVPNRVGGGRHDRDSVGTNITGKLKRVDIKMTFHKK